MPIKQAYLRELLDYDPSSGQFTWKVNRGGPIRAGDIAGTIRHRRGGHQIKIDQSIYPTARLAWLWMTGQWPTELIDHINLNPADNRWCNLRQASFSQNGANSRARRELKGVTWDKARGKFQARIRVNYHNFYLGRFETAELAHAAYAKAAREHFGEFARF